MNIRKLLSLILAVLMLLSFCVGCGQTKTPDTTEPSATEQPAAESAAAENSTTETEATPEVTEPETKHVSNLVIGTTMAQDTFNLYGQQDAFGRLNYVGMCRGNWIYEAEDGTLQPYFFTSFNISEDGCVLDFTWPTTAIWSDGTPVTFDDISFTIKFLQETVGSPYFLNLVSVESTGSDSGRITFSEPDVYGWLVGSAMMQGVIPKHIWEKFEGTEDYKDYNEADASVGCGPYRLVSNDVDGQISYYEAIPENNYHGEITIDTLTVKTYADATAVMVAMNQGEIDCYYSYSSPISFDLIELVTDPAVDLGQSVYSGENQITFGMSRPAGSDYSFRKACTLCFNWDLLGKTIGGDYYTIPGSGLIAPTCTGYVEGLPQFYQSVEEAAALLDEAGYVDINNDGWREFPDGSEMDILVVPQYSKSMDLRNRLAEILMDNLKDIGVKSHIDSEMLASSTVWENNILEGNYDIAIGYTTSGIARHTSAFRYYVYEPKPGTDRTTSWLWGTNPDPEFNSTIWRMLGAHTAEEYLECIQWLQVNCSETLFGAALAWTDCFWPYRTDKYDGWYNRAAWGVVNDELWYTLTAK